MNIPEQQQIDHWLNVASGDLERRKTHTQDGFYERENLYVQGLYTGYAGIYADLARTMFLNGELNIAFRAEFSNASRNMLKSFTMAYDKNDPDYVGDKETPADYTGTYFDRPQYGYVDWSSVEALDAINGFNWALMAGDFELGKELANWFQDSPDEKRDDAITRYAHAMKYALIGSHVREAGKTLLMQTIDKCRKKPPKGGWKLNFYTLSLALYGILDKDQALFNEGLALQLQFYQAEA
ncbi:MAG: hypothetical protein ACKE51_07750, partial [Methylococcaceae bacterium]